MLVNGMVFLVNKVLFLSINYNLNQYKKEHDERAPLYRFRLEIKL